jgi:hypothetical protein
MLSAVVVVADVGGDGLNGGVEESGAKGEPSDVLEDVGVLDGFSGRFSPGEGGVTGNQDSGDGNGIEMVEAETADDDGAGVADVSGGDFFGGEGFGEGDRAVEVVGVGGSQAGDRTAGLGPGGSEFRMRMDDAAELGKFAVEQGMGVEIAGGAEAAFDDGAVEIGDDEVGGGEGGVVDATGLDDDEGPVAAAVDTAGIAEGVGREAAAGNFLVGFENLLA